AQSHSVGMQRIEQVIEGGRNQSAGNSKQSRSLGPEPCRTDLTSNFQAIRPIRRQYGRVHGFGRNVLRYGHSKQRVLWWNISSTSVNTGFQQSSRRCVGQI